MVVYDNFSQSSVTNLCPLSIVYGMEMTKTVHITSNYRQIRSPNYCMCLVVSSIVEESMAKIAHQIADWTLGYQKYSRAEGRHKCSSSPEVCQFPHQKYLLFEGPLTNLMSNSRILLNLNRYLQSKIPDQWRSGDESRQGFTLALEQTSPEVQNIGTVGLTRITDVLHYKKSFVSVRSNQITCH